MKRKYLIVENDIPYIDWDTVNKELKEAGGKGTEPFFTNLIEEWLPKLEAWLHLSCVLVESETLLYFTYFPEKTARERSLIIDGVRKRIVEAFGDIVPKTYVGKGLVIEFEKLDTYYKYISHFYPKSKDPEKAEVYSQSGGCMCNDGYIQVVLNNDAKAHLSVIAAHETTHVFLAYYRLPRWLDEGIATNAESLFSSGRSRFTQEDQIVEAPTHWNRELFEQFLNGEIVHDYEAQYASYALAYMIVHNMLEDGVDFPKLLQKIRSKTKIRLAVEEVAGKDLMEYVPPRERDEITGKH